MRPLDVVQPLVGPYRGSAGVVESVELDEKTKDVSRVVVDHDRDHKRLTYTPSDLRVLKPHG